MKTDSALQRDALDELKYEPRVDHSHIGVTAKDGVVTLTGFVPDYSQKICAEKAVRRVSGVKAIAQDIEVRFASDPKTSDPEIAGRILNILAWDVTLPGDGIKVKVEHGWVTLTGTVDWQYQRRAAAKATGRIAGVKGVSNLVEVRVQPATADVRDRIVAAFKRSSLLDANSINVAVEGGTVKLSGRVHGWNERKVAETAAWAAPGVSKVEDNIVFA